jgi:hypothetical protein
MLGSRTVRFNRRRGLAVAVAALTPLLALPASAVANDPPVVTNATVTPTTVTYLGGTVTITADVSDDTGALNSVEAEMYGPYFFPVALSQVGGDQWSGTVELPANLRPDPASWQIYVRARDNDLAEGIGIAGTVTVDAEPAVDEPPAVFDPAVAPRSVPSTGGPVTLEVSATDLYGIQQAYAGVTGPGGATTYVVLDAVGGDRFRGVFAAPANAGAAPVQYAVAMTALDRRSQPTTIDAGLFTVAGPAGPLKLSQTSLAFGGVKVGHRARRSFVLRNDGKRSTAPVSGVLVAPGGAFTLVGAGPGGIAFTLRPGQSKSYTVEFRPTAPGPQTGTVAVRRSDNGQPGLAVALSGRGAG